ncbi:uncharacterized protein LOC111593105 [Drosophila hydei]|uniref:Uncharacterized protein LOC111593105 n=1 Tax=Drosophila hydei TaxID=7224 RepID=A0A6J1L8V5_DROHY|nr:uncharacterized protein LOC111593105 [Drosophila hydei]
MESHSLLALLLLGLCSTIGASLLNCNCPPGPRGPPGPTGPPGLSGLSRRAEFIPSIWGYPPVPGPIAPIMAGLGPDTFGQSISTSIGNLIIIPSNLNGRAQLFRITPDGNLIRVENSKNELNEILPPNFQDLLTQQGAVPTADPTAVITPPTPDDQPEELDESMFATAGQSVERKELLRASSDANDWRRVLLLGEKPAVSAGNAEPSSTSQLESSMDSFQRALVDLKDKYASLIQPKAGDQRYAVIL